ncbi:hypothetical protein P1J78_05250 [Psychromarinibacter sp. C21-152]|uniref:Peptidase M15 n=1 Tax=Psychromarinibacter sediminicola TaxID=3033385 RepID=A0AAE3NQB2_9RHOB|nr:hypothetical protein [Psychromarinibacter sediminicola]MDF0600131.1 hypothetical protein [Psychromarinibacter sediminicola]
MRAPGSYVGLEKLGRVRLSRHFELRNFLYSEIANHYGRSNVPEDPGLLIAAGRRLAEDLLDPLVETFGPIDIRSGYRSPALNHFGATEVRPQKCSSNEVSRAGHIWDRRDAAGRMGATVSIAVPWFAAQYNAGRDWRDLAWWLYDHLAFHAVCFFPNNAAFNLTWREEPERVVSSYIAPKGKLAGAGRVPDPERHARYADFPPYRGIAYPEIPGRADSELTHAQPV